MEPDVTVEAEEPHPFADLIARALALPGAPDRDAVLSNLCALAYERMVDAETDVQDIEDRDARRKAAEAAR